MFVVIPDSQDWTQRTMTTQMHLLKQEHCTVTAHVVTHHQTQAPASLSFLLELPHQVIISDIVSLQPADAMLSKVCNYLRDLSVNSNSTTDLDPLPGLHHQMMALPSSAYQGRTS